MLTNISPKKKLENVPSKNRGKWLKVRYFNSCVHFCHERDKRLYFDDSGGNEYDSTKLALKTLSEIPRQNFRVKFHRKSTGNWCRSIQSSQFLTFTMHCWLWFSEKCFWWADSRALSQAWQIWAQLLRMTSSADFGLRFFIKAIIETKTINI